MEIKLFLSKIHYFETKISFSISYLNIYEIQEYFNWLFCGRFVPFLSIIFSITLCQSHCCDFKEINDQVLG